MLWLQEQLQAYTAWVNSQLKKRPGSRVVESLPRDMNDGVALIQLIEVVGEYGNENKEFLVIILLIVLKVVVIFFLLFLSLFSILFNSTSIRL